MKPAPNAYGLIFAAGFFVAACPQEQSGTRAKNQPLAPAVAAGGAMGQLDAASNGPPYDAGGPDAGDAARAPVVGDWLETGLYRLKLGRFKRCDDSSTTEIGTATRQVGGGPSPADGSHSLAKAPKEKVWMGFFVEIEAKRNESFISPRDTTLQRGGIILEAKFHEHPDFPRCSPLFPQKVSRKGETLRGYVLYEIPPSFRAAPGPTTLVYRPTRWGGAPRVRLKIPDCLDRCLETERGTNIEDPASSPVRSRNKPRAH